MVDSLSEAWDKARTHMMLHNNKVNHVKGFMTNVIFILLKAGWSPKAYNLWIEPGGINKWILGKDIVAPEAVTAAIINSHLAINLIRASTHYQGGGMAKGIDTDTTLSVMSV